MVLTKCIEEELQTSKNKIKLNSGNKGSSIMKSIECAPMIRGEENMPNNETPQNSLYRHRNLQKVSDTVFNL
jgi:hypothetical protein